ncbi:hypothetical protein DFH27DRAFT_544005 [Peziza echinospora]|nr:hypothetical protein DFH27DRAFT_544005 [Peziza echinospora]
MTISTSRLCLSLSLLVTGYLIWGVSVGNGLITLCGDAAEAARLPDGTPLRVRYTRIPPIDFILTTNVIFFHDFVKDPEGRWALANGYILLFAILACQMVEAGRKYAKRTRSLSLPGTWNVAGQVLGVGMLNPVYYFHHLKNVGGLEARTKAADKDSEDTVGDGGGGVDGYAVTPHHAYAILPSIILGAIVPFTLLFRLAPELPIPTYQIALAAIQPFGFYVSGIHKLLSGLLLSSILPAAAVARHNNPKNAAAAPEVPALRLTYAAMLAFTTIMHNIIRLTRLETLALGGASADIDAAQIAATAFTWRSLYIPSLSSVSRLGDIAKVFMRNDVIVLGLGAVVWAGITLKRESPSSPSSSLKIAAALAAGYVVLGPGATCVLAFWAREEIIIRKRSEAAAGPGKVGVENDKKGL